MANRSFARARNLALRPLWLVSCLAAVLGSGSLKVQAQAQQSRSITLAEVVARAKANPPAVLAALATLERRRQEEALARGSYFPTLSLEAHAGLNYNNQPYLINQGSNAQGMPNLHTVRIHSTATSPGTSGTFNATLFDATRGKNVKAAKSTIEAQESATNSAQRTAIEGAISLYFQVLGARALIADAQLTLDRRTAQHASIEALARAGLRPPIDEQRANVEVVSATAAVQIREIEERALESAFASALGEDPLGALRPADTESESESELGPLASPEEAVAQALDHRPEMAQRRAELQSIVAQDQSARAALLPTFGISGNGSVSQVNIHSGLGQEGMFYSAQGSLYLRWAALDATVWRKTHVTGAQVLEAERQLDITALQVRSDAVAATFAAQRAHAVLNQAEQVLAGAEVTRTSQNERYRAGVATLLELLDSEALEQTARLTRIQARRDYDVARAKLLSACGLLDQLTR